MNTSEYSKFSFFVPLEKSLNGQRRDSSKRWIKGCAATEDRDFEADTMLLKGMDTSYFLRFGWFNNDHLKGVQNKVGIPTHGEVASNKFLVEGFLLKGMSAADEIWNLASILEAEDLNRSLGFSVEGKILSRHGKIIAKSWIKDVAITANPINSVTYLELMKSLSSQHFHYDTCEDLHSPHHPGDLCAEGQIEFAKALSAAGTPAEPGEEGGAALIPQSLDKDRKNKTQPFGSAIVQPDLTEIKKSLGEILNRDSAISYVQKLHGYPREMAAKIVEFTLRRECGHDATL